MLNTNVTWFTFGAWALALCAKHVLGVTAAWWPTPRWTGLCDCVVAVQPVSHSTQSQRAITSTRSPRKPLSDLVTEVSNLTCRVITSSSRKITEHSV